MCAASFFQVAANIETKKIKRKNKSGALWISFSKYTFLHMDSKRNVVEFVSPSIEHITVKGKKGLGERLTAGRENSDLYYANW
jgi:hypothetical protein